MLVPAIIDLSGSFTTTRSTTFSTCTSMTSGYGHMPTTILLTNRMLTLYR